MWDDGDLCIRWAADGGWTGRPVRDMRLREEELPKGRTFSPSYVAKKPKPEPIEPAASGVTEAAVRDYRRAMRSWRTRKA